MRLEWYDMQDMAEDVIKFNVMAKGIATIYSPVSKQFYDRLKVQLKLLQEEVDETLEAIDNKDNPEILKEAIDVGVVWMGMMGILRAAGFNIQQGMEDVCNNNLSKILNSEEEAKQSIEALKNQGTEAYIEEVFYFGETYYALRRKGDNKILKPYNYRKITLEHCVPVIH